MSAAGDAGRWEWRRAVPALLFALTAGGALLVLAPPRHSSPGKALVMTLLVGTALPAWWLLVVGGDEVRSSPEGVAGGRWRRRAVLLGLLPPLVTLLVWGLARRVDLVFTTALTAGATDTLPLIREALASLLRGEGPYRVYEMPWRLPLTFLPGLWLPQLPSVLLGLDLRWVTLVGSFLAAVYLGGTAVDRLVRRPADLSAWSALVVTCCFWLSEEAGVAFVARGHVQLFWLMVTGYGVELARGRDRRAALWLGCSLATRQTAWLLLPALVAWLARQRRWGEIGRTWWPALMIPLMLVLPFLALQPEGMMAGVLGWYDHLGAVLWARHPETLRATPGLTAWLRALGYGDWVVPLRLAGAALVTGLTLWRCRRRWQVVFWGSLQVVVFLMFAPTPWFYAWVPPLLLLTAGIATLWRPVAEDRRRLAWGPLLLGGLAVFGAVFMWTRGVPEGLDPTTPGAERYLGRGWARERVEAGPAFVSTLRRMTLVLPALSRRDRRLDLTMAASVSGRLTIRVGGEEVAGARLDGTWRRLSFLVPRSAWTIGGNRVELLFFPDRPTRATLVFLRSIRLAGNAVARPSAPPGAAVAMYGVGSWTAGWCRGTRGGRGVIAQRAELVIAAVAPWGRRPVMVLRLSGDAHPDIEVCSADGSCLEPHLEAAGDGGALLTIDLAHRPLGVGVTRLDLTNRAATALEVEGAVLDPDPGVSSKTVTMRVLCR